MEVAKIFRTDRDDNKRIDEWDVGAGQGDIVGDDDVDILIRDNNQVVVEYR